ncbi:DUF1570 domain-containing protein [Thalassoroseus pseudoceratinae]|uniref:DUF1570 domain-containing protein n=1 Tax=Thalassoroseus pseudoceratinae TaxID=2713176 RepID=UPI0014236C37|nr:DUF1570 domain-containing protein [Thalassoroseus pseudoceratinae]
MAVTQTTQPSRVWRVVLPMVWLLIGCQATQLQSVGPPSRHSVRSDHLLVLSNFKLPPEHELIVDLEQMRDHITSELQLPPQRREVVVYLFSGQLEYTQYLNRTYPGLPQRRAYFVGTPTELAVFTFWGKRIQEDLRHEYTHGVLHASLGHVPLWIDEGLAEYFEVKGNMNSRTVASLNRQLADGWRPDIRALESLTEFSAMQQPHYEEAWAWVHFCMHSSPETREALLAYLADLQSGNVAKPLSDRLAEAVPHFEDRLLVYLSALPKS